ncbi:hypothetical protein HYT54_03060 [Candidatus Woesearchaeota archaeon]|nr:hypothetical protein [Candidatus Woesearchaeota archaeon]
MASLISKGRIIEYPDIVIAATFTAVGGNYLITLNKSHFESIPQLKSKVFTPREFSEEMPRT